MKRFLLTAVAALNLLVVDQFAKACTLAYLELGRSVSIVDGFFAFTHVQNRGCAWGLFQGQVWPLAAFGVFALIVLVWKRKTFFTQDFSGAVCETMLYAGLVGNLFDRVFRGAVIDMIDCHWGEYHFPVFNVADIYITLAAAILVFSALFGEQEKKA